MVSAPMNKSGGIFCRGRVYESNEEKNKSGSLTCTSGPLDEVTPYLSQEVKTHYPTEQARKYRDKKKADKLAGKTDTKKREQTVEQHWGDCGNDLGELDHLLYAEETCEECGDHEVSRSIYYDSTFECYQDVDWPGICSPYRTPP